MSNKRRLALGPLTVSNINWNYVLAGITILLSTITLYVFLDETKNSTLNLVFGVFALIGIFCIAFALSRNTNTIYLRKGRCNILKGSIRCSGGCKKCSFANVYLQRILNGEDPSDDEVGEPVFIGNERKNPEIHQNMRQYDRE